MVLQKNRKAWLGITFILLCVFCWGKNSIAEVKKLQAVEEIAGTAIANKTVIKKIPGAPVSLLKSIRLKKIDPESVHPRGQVTDCFLTSISDNEMTLTLAYQVQEAAQTPVYAGAWLYEARKKAVDAGYKPAQLTTLPDGTLELTIVFHDFPFTGSYLEAFLIQNGKMFGHSQFRFPFAWTGKNGRLLKAGQPLASDWQPGRTGNTQDKSEPRKNFCLRYADMAVAQFHLGQQYQVDGVIAPFWTDDKAAHLNWCLQTDLQIVQANDRMRAQHLLTSLPKTVLDDMKKRGLKVPALDPGLGP